MGEQAVTMQALEDHEYYEYYEEFKKLVRSIITGGK